MEIGGWMMNGQEYANAQFEIAERTLDVTRVGCKFSRVKSIERQHQRGCAARAVVDGRLGYASHTGRVDENRLIQRAIETARKGAPIPLVFPASNVFGDRSDPRLIDLSESDLRQIAEEVLAGIGRGRPEIVIELELRRVCETNHLRNTSGGQVDLRRAWLEGEVWVERHAGDEVLVILDSFATAQHDETHREFARRMARRLRWAQRPVRPKPGAQSVVFSPSAFASLLRPMLLGLNGAQALPAGSRGGKHAARLLDRIGHQVFDPRFSLSDDPTLPGRPHSAPVDHEGTPGRRTALIEHGVVKGFYHSLQSAAMAGTRSTGHGWRWMMDPPQPALTNVVVEQGRSSLADMLKGLNDGILIDMVMGSDGSTGVEGRFSRTVALAYQIERGRVVGYIRGVGAAGNLYGSLKRVEALSRDSFWAGAINAPYIRLGEVNVTV